MQMCRDALEDQGLAEELAVWWIDGVTELQNNAVTERQRERENGQTIKMNNADAQKFRSHFTSMHSLAILFDLCRAVITIL